MSIRVVHASIAHMSSPERMSEKIYNVLFLCTGNAARSILRRGTCATLGARKISWLQCRQQAEG